VANAGEGTAHGELTDLAWIEALGALDPSDRARLAAHLREGCPSCLEALRSGNDVVAKLAHLFAPATPSEALRARIERASARRTPEGAAELRRPPRRVRLASAASWVAVALAAVFGANRWLEAERVRSELAAERARRAEEREALAHAETRREALVREHAELSELLVAVANGDARAIALAGQAGSAQAFVRENRLVLFVNGLPSAPAGQTYQAWAIEGGVPRSAGVFDTDAAGHAQHRNALASDIAADAVIAVTVEPEGGVPQPTGPIILAQR
jgi:anti-sigma-K factor RskA